jgi:hypothetical protein
LGDISIFSWVQIPPSPLCKPVAAVTAEVALNVSSLGVPQFTFEVSPTAARCGNKLDLPGSEANLRVLKKFVNGKLPIVAMSCEHKIGVDELGRAFFESLGVIRVYTKQPGSHEPTGRPFVLKHGATVNDLAKNIHKEFVQNFLFAMVWAKPLPFSPKKVGLGFALGRRGHSGNSHENID